MKSRGHPLVPLSTTKFERPLFFVAVCGEKPNIRSIMGCGRDTGYQIYNCQYRYLQLNTPSENITVLLAVITRKRGQNNNFKAELQGLQLLISNK